MRNCFLASLGVLLASCTFCFRLEYKKGLILSKSPLTSTPCGCITRMAGHALTMGANLSARAAAAQPIQ